MSTSHLFRSATFVALLLAMTAVAAYAQNIVVNPGFESGDLTGWQALNLSGSASITVQAGDNGPGAAGTHNAFMSNQSEALGLTLKLSTLPGTAGPGTVYYSYDLKLGQAANGGVFFVEVFAENSVGAVIGTSGLKGNYGPASWTTYTGSFVAPANTDHLTIQFMANTGAVTGSASSMHVDNVDLHQATAVPVQSSSWGRIKALYR